MRYFFRAGFTLFLGALLFMFCACSAAGNSGAFGEAPSAPMYQTSRATAYDGVSELGGTMPEPMAAEGNFDLEAPEGSLSGFLGEETQGRKLIKHAELHLRVDDPGDVEKPLADLMKKYGAWPASAGIYENSRNYTIRVPSPSYDAMLAGLIGLGRVLRRTENAEDVTLRYYDLESRLETKRGLLRTYQSYLGRANNIEEIMTVESWIANLQREIDQTGTQFRNLANLIDYSTIDVEISGPVSYYSKPSLGEKLGELFSAFGEVASSALLVLTGIIIYGVPAILILILLFWLLFGRIGLIKKVWRLAVGKKS